MKTSQYRLNSRLGPLFLVASERGLQGAFWQKRPGPLLADLEGEGAEIEVLKEAAKQFGEFLAGKRREFDLPTDVQGTGFQKAVWAELARIPYGQTVSYSDIARKIKNEKAVRAVGTANGKNPISILVPCHRVIAADGTLGGYAGGLENKRKLLDLERENR